MRLLRVFLILILTIETSILCFTKPVNEEYEIPVTENVLIGKSNIINNTIMAKLNSMSLDDKIAQMLFLTIPGTKVTDNMQNSWSEHNPGGVILLKNNITSYEQTKSFISDMQEIVDIPLFVATDQEGGKVQKIKNFTDYNITVIPSMKDVGSANDLQLTYQVGDVIAKEMHSLGFNMDFAPVLDVVTKNSNVIGNRSFGSDPLLVKDQGLTLGNALIDNGVIPVYKHFPGHGSTITDSHKDLPILTETKEELYDVNLIPFIGAIENDAKVIMIGHLAIPNITGDNTPASLSKDLITGLLKDELGYDGIVITDALNMKALTKNYSEKEIYELAINAGVDILLMPNSLNSAINNIKKSIEEGKISEEQINNSVLKILKLKATSLNLDIPALTDEDLANHQDIIKQITKK